MEITTMHWIIIFSVFLAWITFVMIYLSNNRFKRQKYQDEMKLKYRENNIPDTETMRFAEKIDSFFPSLMEEISMIVDKAIKRSFNDGPGEMMAMESYQRIKDLLRRFEKSGFQNPQLEEMQGRQYMQLKKTENLIEKLMYQMKNMDKVSKCMDMFDHMLYKMDKLTSPISKLNDLIGNIEGIISSNKNITADKKNIEDRQLIREISHSLNTPLSIIEVKANQMLSIQQEQIDISEMRKSMQSTLDSVNICKSVLATYRELTLVANTSTIWSPNSVKEALISASNVYANKLEKKVKFSAEIPDEIPGYSNNFIIALLLPIIENAIEANIDNGAINVVYTKDKKLGYIKISNMPKILPKSDEIFKSGFTTKQEHEGVGLSLVKNLLSSQSEANIRYEIKDNIVTFIIQIPSK